VTLFNHHEIAKHYKEKYAQTSYPFHLTAPISTDINLSDWIKIPVNLDRINSKLLPFIIAISEIFRFEIGITQPEYRLSTDSILSLKVKQTTALHSQKTRTLIDDWHLLTGMQKQFWEGMGRAVFVKYLFQDNDFSINNALVDKNNYFVALDPDKCFWSVTSKYHYFRDIKVITNNNCPFPVTPFKTAAGRPLFIIKDKHSSFIGDLHKEDYDNLPLLRHQYPSDWFFLLSELKPYSKTLSNNMRFLNEKHFSTLKSLVTKLIKNVLLELHLDDEQDKHDALALVASQLQKLSEIGKQSEKFKHYLQQHGFQAMHAVIYEIHQFIKSTHHYHLDNSEIQTAIEESIYETVIDEYTQLLSHMNFTELSHEEKLQLKQYVRQIQNETSDARHIARDFYLSQKMTYHANSIRL